METCRCPLPEGQTLVTEWGPKMEWPDPVVSQHREAGIQLIFLWEAGTGSK